MLRYLSELQPGGLPHLIRPTIRRSEAFLWIDEMTRRNLEVLAQTRVRRVLFDGKLAVGVEAQARDGIKRLRARKEKASL